MLLASHIVAVLSFSPVLLPATVQSRHAPLAHFSTPEQLSNLAQQPAARLPRCYIAASEERPALSDAAVVDAFREFDTSGDGFIDLAELDAALSKAGMPVSSTAAADILKRADANSDGQISLEEFKEVFKLNEVPAELQPLMVCVRGVCVLPEEVDVDVEALEDGESSAVDFWWPRALLLACSVSYGANFPAGKIMCEAVDPAVASCLRFALASIALSPFLLQTPRGLIRPAIVCGLFTSFGYVGQAIALQTASAAEVGFICSLAVVVCPLLDLLDGKQIPWQSWAAAALALIGVGVLELGDAGIALSPGDLWAFTQPIGFGVTFWKTGKMMSDFPTETLSITAIQVAVAAVTSLVWLGLTGSAVDGALLGDLLGSPAALGAVVWTGIVGSALTTTGLTVALGRVSSTEASVLLTTEPLWAALLAFWLLQESVGSNVLSGGALILAACLANALGAEPEKEPAVQK